MTADHDRHHECPAPRRLFRFSFGSAEFDEMRQELRVAGMLVEVQNKPLQVLAALLGRPREVLSKDELLARVWGGVVVEEGSLSNAVSKLRAALGAATAAAIVTVPGSGYRFDSPLRREAVGTQPQSRLDLTPGAPVPARQAYRLVALLGGSQTNETWLAAHDSTGERRIYKFSVGGQTLSNLKREARVHAYLREKLGDRDDIARVLEWNFEHPPFWLECEWAGVALDRWAAEEAAPPGHGHTRLAATAAAQRLELWLQIADAVAAAHGSGIVHGDLKPANVLIRTDGDADGRPKSCLADFGSARLLDPENLAALRISQLSATLNGADASSGTPFYMAPELARGEPPSLRSDVYALGVMLYQLLAGELRRQLAPGWERDIDDELMRADVAAATDVDAQRRPESALALARLVRELPTRRLMLAERRRSDAQAAVTQAALSRARARQPWMLAAAVALLLGCVTSTVLYLAERRSERALAQQFAFARALNELLRDDLVAAANPARSGRAGITVADALQASAARIDTRFAGQPPAVRAGLHAAMHNALSELSRSDDAVAEGRRALAAWASDAAPDRDQMQTTRLRLALDLVQESQLEGAAAVVRDFERDAGPPAQQPAVQRARLLYVKSWLSGGELALQQSLGELQSAYALVEGLTEEQAPWREKIMFALADDLVMLGRGVEAEALLQRLLAEQSARDGAGSVRTQVTQVALGKALAQQGRKAEARTLLQATAAALAQGLGAGHRLTLDARDLLAGLQFDAGDFKGAAGEWEAVRLGLAALAGAGSSYALTAQTNQAVALQRGGSPNQAAPLLGDALEHARTFLKDDEPQAQQIRYHLADCLLDLQRRAEAAPLAVGLTAAALNAAEPASDWPQRLQALQRRVAEMR